MTNSIKACLFAILLFFKSSAQSNKDSLHLEFIKAVRESQMLYKNDTAVLAKLANIKTNGTIVLSTIDRYPSCLTPALFKVLENNVTLLKKH